MYALARVSRGSVPKTASGKTRSRACRADYLGSRLDTIASWVAPGPGSDDRPRPEAPAIVPGRTAIPASAEGEAGGTPAAEFAAENVSRRSGDDLNGWLRDYAEDRINSRLMDERRSIPPYILLDFGNRGLLGMQLPERYGGLALRYRDFLRLIEQLAAIDLTLAPVVFLNNSMASVPSSISRGPRSARNSCRCWSEAGSSPPSR